MKNYNKVLLLGWVTTFAIRLTALTTGHFSLWSPLHVTSVAFMKKKRAQLALYTFTSMIVFSFFANRVLSDERYHLGANLLNASLMTIAVLAVSLVYWYKPQIKIQKKLWKRCLMHLALSFGTLILFDLFCVIVLSFSYPFLMVLIGQIAFTVPRMLLLLLQFPISLAFENMAEYGTPIPNFRVMVNNFATWFSKRFKNEYIE